MLDIFQQLQMWLIQTEFRLIITRLMFALVFWVLFLTHVRYTTIQKFGVSKV